MEINDVAQAQILTQAAHVVPVGVGVYMAILLIFGFFVFFINVQNGCRLFRLSRYLKKHHYHLWVELGFSLDDYGLTADEIIVRRDKWFGNRLADFGPLTRSPFLADSPDRRARRAGCRRP